MPKLEKSVLIRRVRWLLILGYALVGSLMLNLVQCAAYDQATYARGAYQRAMFRNWGTIDRLEHELSRMAELAESWRFTALYEECVGRRTGIVAFGSVRLAYDRTSYPSGVTKMCLAETARNPDYAEQIRPLLHGR